MGYLISSRWVTCIVATVLVTGCGAKPVDRPSVHAPDWTTFVGGHARVVWVEPKDDLNDVFLAGTNHALMGIDSRDGMSREIVRMEQVTRPLISPDGSYVVFSGLRNNRIFRIPWEGGTPADIGEGIALALHRDPATGRDWVYAAQEPLHDDRGHFKRLVRRPVDEPSSAAMVADVSSVAVEGVGLSRSGSLLVGLFPWPRAFLVHTATGDIEPIGRGCWTAIAPDDSGLAWIFQGTHREFTLRALDGTSWPVRANTAPGVDGAKMYHPRWSNHPRYFIATGPYRTESLRKLAPDAGQGVELFIGRFSEDYKAVEAWSRVTTDRAPAYSPDLWIADGAASAVPASVSSPANATSPKRETWPGTTDGLFFAWANALARNDAVDPRIGKRVESVVEPSGHARLSRTFGMLVSGGGYTARDLGTVFRQAVSQTGAFTLEAVLTSYLSTSNAATILSTPLFDLVQQGDRLILRASSDADIATLSRQPTHLVLAVEDGQARVSIDGSPSATFPFSPRATSPDARDITFGFSEWQGEIDSVSLRARAVSDSETATLHRLLGDSLSKRAPMDLVRVKGRLIEGTPTPDAASIAPYRRALALYVYELEPGEPDIDGSRRIQVYHWVMFDGVAVGGEPAVGDVRELTLSSTLDHPELESERRLIGTEAFDLPEFLDVSR